MKKIILVHGHRSDARKTGKGCVMDFVSLEIDPDGPVSDGPRPCVWEPARRAVIALNDAPWSSDTARTRAMRPLIRALPGSATDDAEVSAKRVRLLVLGAIREDAADALKAAGLTDHAKKLRALPDDASYTELRAAARAAWAAEAAEAAEAAVWAAEARAAVWAAEAAVWAAEARASDRILRRFTKRLLAALAIR